jgi:hypothetical protein
MSHPRVLREYKFDIDTDCYVWDELGQKHEGIIVDRSTSAGWPRYLVSVQPISFLVWKDEGNVDLR